MEQIRTLVVDDELGMRMSVKRALSKFTMTIPDIEGEFGFEIDVAETAEEALAKIEKQRPDLLLLDYKLPGMSGLDLLSQVTPQPHEMLTIMITAYASIETAVVAVKSGAFDFLAKPFTPEEMKKTVTKAARRLILARQVRKLAREKHKVRFQFVSVLGHELKAPLNSVDGYLDIMKNKKLGDDITAYETMVDRCQVRIQGMRKIIHDLLDLTQIESGERERELKAYDLRETVKLAIETALPEAGERKITLNFEAEEPVIFSADPSEIEIIMNNLISNAVKYNKDEGTVDISLKKISDGVQIEVTDSGIGMTEAEASRLFHEFVRIKNEKTRKILGSGLGLTILKKIAQMYHGDVSVKSQPDVGSTFTVVLKAENETN